MRAQRTSFRQYFYSLFCLSIPSVQKFLAIRPHEKLNDDKVAHLGGPNTTEQLYVSPPTNQTKHHDAST